MTSDPAPQPGPSQSGSTSSGKSVTPLGDFRSLPRVDPSDVLENWTDYASWVFRTSRILRVSGVLIGDAVADNCEDHAMVILTSRLSKGILQQGRSHVTFVDLWSWLVVNCSLQSGHILCASLFCLFSVPHIHTVCVEQYFQFYVRMDCLCFLLSFRFAVAHCLCLPLPLLATSFENRPFFMVFSFFCGRRQSASM